MVKAGKIIKKFKLDDKEIIFRHPRFEDLDKILKWINTFVDEKAYLATQTKVKRDREIDFMVNTLKSMELKSSVSIVVEMNGNIVGMSDVVKNKMKCKNHIGNFGIALSKIARGTGIAEKLVSELFKIAKRDLKISIVALEVISNNKRAFNFYEKIGFKFIGTIKNGISHYGKLMDETIMVKYI